MVHVGETGRRSSEKGGLTQEAACMSLQVASVVSKPNKAHGGMGERRTFFLWACTSA